MEKKPASEPTLLYVVLYYEGDLHGTDCFSIPLSGTECARHRFYPGHDCQALPQGKKPYSPSFVPGLELASAKWQAQRVCGPRSSFAP